jgi:septum formation protein
MSEHVQPPMRPEADLARRLRRRLEEERRAASARFVQPPEPFLLASASPRRRELLQSLGLSFEVVPADIDEIPARGEGPRQFAVRAAEEKAAWVADRRRSRRILAADTVVALDDVIFGKPRDRADAGRMLQALSGATHRVFTAIVLLTETRKEKAVAVETAVAFRPIGTAEIDAYVDSAEPFDKAGAYGIQGRAAAFVTAVLGSYSNVIGLPLEEVAALLSAGRGS